MGTRDFSGSDLISVLCNMGGFRIDRVTGDHYILKWEPPDDHDTDTRTVVVPYHDTIAIGTLNDIASDAGAKDFDEFCQWVDRNR